jgi:hypothetical protein
MKLTIELVPKTCWFSNVRSQVTKADWEILKKETSKNAKRKCEICAGRGPKWPVECHEVWSYDDKKKIQKLERLIALCPSCHEVKHIGFAGTRGRSYIATEHLANVNDISVDDATDYVHGAFVLWRDRSQYNWELDISWLDNRGIEYGDRS